MDAHWPAILIRWFGGLILCFFGYVPGWVFVKVVIVLFDAPSKFDLTALLVLFGSAALTYFFALLAYRAFAGRGRKQDGGLLPPWAMLGFIHAFGVIAVCITVFGFMVEKLQPILGGIGYLVIAYGALLGHKKSRSGENTNA